MSSVLSFTQNSDEGRLFLLKISSLLGDFQTIKEYSTKIDV